MLAGAAWLELDHGRDLESRVFWTYRAWYTYRVFVNFSTFEIQVTALYFCTFYLDVFLTPLSGTTEVHVVHDVQPGRRVSE